MNSWLLIAESDKEIFTAKTNISQNNLLYRAVSKWIIRGGASEILNSFWEYIDKYDNELENALLDQLITQAETKPENPQTTNVRTRDYSIDMTVFSETTNNSLKKCKLEFTCFVYFHSIQKKVRIDTKTISVTLLKINDNIENINVQSISKTPGHSLKANRRVSKRNSKITPII